MVRGKHRPLVGLVLLLAGGCRQMLDLEPARLEPSADSGGNSSALDDDGGGIAKGGAGSSSTPAAGNGSAEAGSGGEPPHGASGATGSEDSGGEASGGSGGEEPLPELDLCEQYCNALEENCTGNLAQFSDYQTCLDTCELLPRGAPNDVEVNSVHCRLAEAEKAGRLEPEFYCPLAGPASAGKCGSSCEAYCDIMMGFCTSDSTSGLYFYEDEEACLADCAVLPMAGEPYSAALHSIGPHFECRLFHACASNIDAEYHCGHAFGDPPCNEP